MPDLIQQHLSKLGHRVKDRVTGAEGVVTTVGFDLFGCVQVIVNRGFDKDGKPYESMWLDIARLEVLSSEPTMTQPDFVEGPVARGEKGPAEKPPNSRY